MIYICDIPPIEQARWIPGDQHIRRPLRRFLEPLRGRPPGGLRKVTENLLAGLRRANVPFEFFTRPSDIPAHKLVGILNGPLELCKEIATRNPCVTGPGILNGSVEWPELFENTLAIFHLQNCEWAAAMYKPQYGDRLRLWTMGIDDEKYRPSTNPPEFDILIYDKIRWRNNPEYSGLLEHCQKQLAAKGCRFHTIQYGKYPGGKEHAYHHMLANSRSMLYLSENETQGFAYNEALSMNIPILAWDIGKWCDPMRFELGLDGAVASSVPYFDSRCGITFKGAADFSDALGEFLVRLEKGDFSPREYVEEHLTLVAGARRYVEILVEAQEYSERAQERRP